MIQTQHMQAKIIKPDSAAEYLTPERCHILELANSAADPALSIARARLESGVTTRQHRVNGSIERYVIVKGAGQVHIEGLVSESVKAGDVVLIPAGATQSITNTGLSDLVFLCICTPRFEWENYESLE